MPGALLGSLLLNYEQPELCPEMPNVTWDGSGGKIGPHWRGTGLDWYVYTMLMDIIWGKNVNDSPSSVCLSCSNLYISMCITVMLEKRSKDRKKM